MVLFGFQLSPVCNFGFGLSTVRNQRVNLCFHCFIKDKSTFKDTIDISLPENVVPGSVHAVVSTVGKCINKVIKPQNVQSNESHWVLFSCNAFCFSL